MDGARVVVVTGHRGYLGSVLTGLLASRGWRVHGVDTGLARPGLLREPTAPAVETTVDIRDVDRDLFDGVEAVVHLAGLSNDPLGALDADLTEEINHLATVRLARLARERGVRRFVFASSCSLYGAAGDHLLDERSPLTPLSAYARAKAAAERGILGLASPRFIAVSLRLATLLGPSPALRTDLVVNRLAVLAHHQGCISLESDGRSWRPFLDVRDAAEVIAAALTAEPLRLTGEALNVVGPGGNRRIEDIARLVGSAVPDSLTVLDPDRPPDPRSYRVSPSRLRRTLGRPARRIEEGVGDVLALISAAGTPLAELLGPGHVRVAAVQAALEAGDLDRSLRPVAVHA